MARAKIPQRPQFNPNDRFTGYGIVQPGAQAGRDYGKEMLAEIMGRLGATHSPDVENSFKIRGRAAYQKGRGY